MQVLAVRLRKAGAGQGGFQKYSLRILVAIPPVPWWGRNRAGYRNTEHRRGGMTVYGLAAKFFSDCSQAEAIRMIADAGFGAVELHPGARALGNWVDHPAETGAALRAAGLRPWSVHADGAGANLSAKDEEDRQRAIEIAVSSFPLARDLGAEVVVCHPNAPKAPFLPEDYDASLQRSRQSLEVLAREAERVGIRIALENMIPRPHKRPAQRVTELLTLIDGLGTHMGICIDTGHNNVAGAPLPEAIREAGASLFTLHLNDNHGEFDRDEHLLPGEGTIDWEACMEALADVGFSAPRILEVNLPDGENPLPRLMDKLAGILRDWNAQTLRGTWTPRSCPSGVNPVQGGNHDARTSCP